MSTRIEIKSSAASRSTAKLMKTGQVTSYRTGDDGDVEAGRGLTFALLLENNPFGNDKRFTDLVGTQVYASNIAIDWSTYDGSTVLGYYTVIPPADVTWNDAIDAANTLSVGSYTSGWRLPNKREMENIFNYELTACMNYSPFNITNTIWTSTTYAAATTLAYTATSSWINLNGKSGLAGRWIAVRDFTVTGTTLT